MHHQVILKKHIDLWQENITLIKTNTQKRKKLLKKFLLHLKFSQMLLKREDMIKILIKISSMHSKDQEVTVQVISFIMMLMKHKIFLNFSSKMNLVIIECIDSSVEEELHLKSSNNSSKEI